MARLRSEGEMAARLLSSKVRSIAALSQQLETQKAAAVALVLVASSKIAAEELQRECAAYYL